ncbi:MAG: hypothetical protein ACRENE_25385 [Polyangiaceae bacterium]
MSHMSHGRQNRLLMFALPALAAGASIAACASTHTAGWDLGQLDGGAEGFDAAFLPPPSPIQPQLGPTVTAQKAPPPISGGTLIVTQDGKYAVAADSDRDSVYVVSLADQSVQTVSLMAGDEPGRLAEDGTGLVHVALRGPGAIVTIDPATAKLQGRQSVCPAPRGVAWDGTAGVVWVACATGELVGLPPGGGSATHSYVIERDLRDVIVSDGALAITHFRTNQLLRVGADGTVTRHDTVASASFGGFDTHVVWRAVPGPAGTIATVHEEESQSLVSTMMQGGYGGGGCGSSGGVSLSLPPPFPAEDGAPPEAEAPLPEASIATLASLPLCLDPEAGGLLPFTGSLNGMQPGCGMDSTIVHSAITVIDSSGSPLFNATFPGAVPVDVAMSPDGAHIAVVAPGNTFGPGLSTVFEFGTCSQATERSLPLTTSPVTPAEPVAVAFGPSNRLLVQTREPAALWFIDSVNPSSVSLSTVSRKDTGHDIFHVQAGGMIACASCHPEGGDDGNVWNLDGSSRRTPSLRGTIAGTAPYHWPGNMKDLPMLFDDVYTVRMNGAKLQSDQVSVLKRWVEAVPAPPSPSWVDSAAASRGKAVFDRAGVGCASCHSGAKLTNNQTVNVGTGGTFQVPPLVGLGWRAPFLHDGCATTLADRFGSCATPGHGNTSTLSAGDLSDLEAYLETL